MLKKILLVMLVLAFAFVGYLYVQARQSGHNPPENLTTMQLKPCPDSPNCVSTEATDDKRREPLPFTGSAAEAKEKLKRVVGGMKRTRLVKEEGNYLHYTFKTWPIPFTDDVEFVIDEAAGVIRYRSASRVGHSDLGVNSARMKKVAAAWNG